MQVELGFENGVIGDIFSVPGYEIRGHVVAQVDHFFFVAARLPRCSW